MNMMNRKNNYRSGHTHNNDQTRSHTHIKYSNHRGRNNRPTSNRVKPTSDDVDMLMDSMKINLSAGGNVAENMNGHRNPRMRGRTKNSKSVNNNHVGWWRIVIPKAGIYGKERVMNSIKTYTSRPFQPYHVRIGFTPLLKNFPRGKMVSMNNYRF